ncbi:autotransporter family protein [Pseudomonas sp. SDO5532_S415]
MNFSSHLPKYRYSACAVSIWLCIGWPQPVQAACTLTPTAGNDNHVCDSGSSGPLTDLAGNNKLSLPTNGTGTINGNVVFGGGNDEVYMNSGRIVGALDQSDGADKLIIRAGEITGPVQQGKGVDDFIMNGGTIQSLAQGDSRDFFLMTEGWIKTAFEDGDTAKMTGGRIGRVDMKLDNNLFDISGGDVDGNVVTGFGTDTIIVSGGKIGGNISVSGGNDSITVTGGEVVGEIRTSVGNDTFLWEKGGILHSAILMEGGDDTATLRNLDESILAQTQRLNGGDDNDVLNLDQTTTSGAARYSNWETANLKNGARFDLDGNLVLGDRASGTGVFNVDSSSTVTSTQGSIMPFTAGQRVMLNNAGTIDLSSGNTRTNDTLTVHGDYVGKDGQLFVQTELGGDGSPSDKLVVIDGTLTRTTSISVSNVGGSGAQTQQNGIMVVDAQGTAISNNDAFTLKAPVEAGAFQYALYKGGITPGSENRWYLRSAVVAAPLVSVPNPDPTLPPILVPLVAAPVAAPGSPSLPTPPPGAAPIPLYRPEVPVWSVLPPAAAKLALTALGTFHDRQGDQRLLTETGSLGAGWGRVYGKDFDQTWAGTVTPRFDGSIKGYLVGNDLYSSQTSGGQTQRTGLFVGDSRLNGDVDGFNQGYQNKRAGKVELEGKNLGLYWTLIDPMSWYVDLVAMYTWLDGESRSDRGLKLDNKGHALTLSAEAGYPIAITDNWDIEPQAQIIHQKVTLDSQDDGISRVSFDSDPAWTGRIGARLKGRYNAGGLPLQPWLRANLWRSLSATDTVTFAGVTDIDTQQKSSWAELGIGADLTLAKNISVYANVGYSSNLDSNQQRGTAATVGVRISW